MTMKQILLSLIACLALALPTTANTPPIDRPGQLYADILFNTWNNPEAVPLGYFHNIAKDLAMTDTDSIVEVQPFDQETGTQMKEYTFFAAKGGRIIHELVPAAPDAPESAGEGLTDSIAFRPDGTGTFIAFAANIACAVGEKPEQYSVDYSDYGSVRFAFNKSEDRDNVLYCLLAKTGFKLSKEEENLYVGTEAETGEPDWGTVIYANDIEEDDGTMLYWIEITSNL